MAITISPAIAASYPNSRRVVRLSNGTLYCVYNRSPNGTWQIYVKKSTNNGQTWTDEILISTYAGMDANTQATPSIAVDSGNNLHVVWHGGATGYSKFQIWYSKFNGADWSEPVRISDLAGMTADNQLYPSIAVDGTDYLHVVWDGRITGMTHDQIWYAKFTYSWQEPVRISTYTDMDIHDQLQAAITVDSSYKVHVVWSGNAAGFVTWNQIWYAKYAGSWVTPVRISDAAGMNAVSNATCSIALDSNDYLHVAFKSDDAIFYTKYTGSWITPIEISTYDGMGIRVQDYPSIAVDSLDVIYVVWQGKAAVPYSDEYKIWLALYTGSWSVELLQDEAVDLYFPNIRWSRYPPGNLPFDGIDYIFFDITNIYWDDYGAPVFGPPEVTTQLCTDIDHESATGNGTLVSLGDSPVTEHGHCWSESHNPTILDDMIDNGAKAETGPFTSAITGLDPETTYYVRAWAANSYGVAYGDEVELTTFAAKAPTVTTEECINVMPETATGQGTIVDKGYEPEQQLENNLGSYLLGSSPYVGQKLTIPNREVTNLSFLIFRTGSPTGEVFFQIRKVSDDSVILSKLWGDAADLPLEDPQWKQVIFDAPATINEAVRLLAYHAGGTVMNSVLIRIQTTDVKADEFMTKGDLGDWDDTTYAAYDVAYKYGYTDTDYDITQHGHCWSTSPNPTTAGDKTSLGAGEIGSFESSITGLTPGETYYVRAYATNQYGTGYGDNVLLVTPTGDIPTVTTQACSAVKPESATGHGNITSFGDDTPSQHGHCWSSTNESPTLADSKNQEGEPAGTGAFTSPITGLVPDTRYYIRAYATNVYGTGYGNVVTIFTYPGGVIINPENPVGIDWADDGLYTDISADVMEEYIEWGKDRELNEAVPSLLALTVDNFNHKYSPPNAASPYNRDGKSVRAGHKVRVAFGYPYDSFNDLDGITLENHVVPKDSQFTWSQKLGTFSILSNKLRETGGGVAIAVIDFGESDAHIQVTFTKGADNDGIIVFRYQGASDYLYLKITSTRLEVRKVNGGDTEVGSEALAWANGVTKTIKVILHGQYIYVVVDNTLLISTSSTHNQTETEHGVGGTLVGDNARYEDFGGIYSLFYGTIDRIIPYPDKVRQTALIEASGDLKILARHILYRRAYSYTAYPGGMRSFIQEVYKNTANVSQLGEIMDVGETISTSPYKSWWGIPALQVCRNVEREENGFFYQDQASFWRFEAKGHRAAAPHNASRCTFYQTYETNNLAFTGLKWASGEEDVFNMISVHVQKSLSHPLNLGTGGQYVWRCAEADVLDGGVDVSLLEIPASSSVIIYFESKDFDCLEDLITPAQASAVYRIEGKITGGPFLLGEVVTGSVSGHTGNVLETSGGYIVLGDCNGAFDVADIWVGATSGATIAIGFKIEGTIANGPFLLGEGITTDVSTDTGIVREVGQDFVLLESASGVFDAGDTVTGATSNATLNGTVTITVVGSKTAIPDYKANAAANGEGADKTGNLTVALAYPVYNSYGKGGKLTLTNDDTDPIFVTRLLVRGDGFNIQDAGSVYVEDADSKIAYGEHSYDVKAEILTSLAEAKTLADDVKTKEIVPRSKVEMTLTNANKEMLTKILSLKLSDRITANYSDMGIDEPFFINKIIYNITQGGQVVEAVLKLEEVS